MQNFVFFQADRIRQEVGAGAEELRERVNRYRSAMGTEHGALQQARLQRARRARHVCCAR